MSQLHAIGVYDMGDVQYLGTITSISGPKVDDEGTDPRPAPTND